MAATVDNLGGSQNHGDNLNKSKKQTAEHVASVSTCFETTNDGAKLPACFIVSGKQ